MAVASDWLVEGCQKMLGATGMLGPKLCRCIGLLLNGRTKWIGLKERLVRKSVSAAWSRLCPHYVLSVLRREALRMEHKLLIDWSEIF